jgi:hypothetical protein
MYPSLRVLPLNLVPTRSVAWRRHVSPRGIVVGPSSPSGCQRVSVASAANLAPHLWTGAVGVGRA